jgi:hypothetical protein
MQYGYWKAKVLKKHKRLASPRQWAPGLLLFSLLVLGVLSEFFDVAANAAVVLMAAYLTALGVGTAVMCAAREQRRFIPLMPVIIGIYHFSFGYGFLRGCFDFVVRQKDRNEGFRALTRRSRPQPR